MVDGPEERDVEALVTTLRRMNESSSRQVYKLIGSILVFGIVLCPLWYRGWVSDSFGGCLMGMLVASLVFGPLLLMFIPNPRLDALFDELARTEDVRAIGPLLEIGRTLSRPKLIRRIRATLIRLLSRIKASDAASLGDNSYQCLLLILEKARVSSEQGLLVTYDPALVVATLEAMAYIGEENALRLITKLVKMQPRTTRDWVIHAVAAKSYAAIMQRFDFTGNTLVRPAEAPEGTTLLRPAGAGSEGDPAHLLRPSSTEQE